MTSRFPSCVIPGLTRNLALALSLAALAPGLASADASESKPRFTNATSDYETGKKAVVRKDWPAAIAALDKAVARDPDDADAQNLLGYANRKQGNMDAAFKHYDVALKLDPKHLGAHEYVGEAYLMVGKPDKAREHLAALQKLCTSCEELEDLQKAIAAYDKKPR
jgi:tetratricopeptide (TPR) repeat protein